MGHSKQTQIGFTLIEVLVVVSIISLIASSTLATFVTVRTKARDTRRKADLKQINTALAFYYDTNGTYPNCPPWLYSNDATWNTNCLATALQPWLRVLPKDPRNISTGLNFNRGPWFVGNYVYAYAVRPDLQQYDLVAQLESVNDQDRCQVRNWLFRYYTPGVTASWCSVTYNYSPYLYADH